MKLDIRRAAWLLLLLLAISYHSARGFLMATQLADPAARYRLYAGFSGWMPRQLQSEFMRDGWHVLPADEATLFRGGFDGLWEELLERALRLGPRVSR